MGEKVWKNIVAVVGIGVGIGIFSLLNHFLNLIPIFNSTQPTSAQDVTFAGGFANFLIALGQFRNQRKQIKVHEDQYVNDRFTTAVDLLGSDKTSARVGAIYALYQLAVDDEKYRSQIAQILCSHVRSHTNERKYQKHHKDRLSDEIQTTINLLVRAENNTKGLYCQNFRDELPRADFNHAYLMGADFSGAWCQDADFRKAQCQEADFRKAQCQDANFSRAQCERANFEDAQCLSTKFPRANCQSTNFSRTQCERANFSEAQCQGANFYKAGCRGAYFVRAQCQDANFSRTQCQDAMFPNARCQGASFIGAQCQRVNFSGTQCQGANFFKALCQDAYFYKTQCQGAYTTEDAQSLKDRIGKVTKLKHVTIAGNGMQSINQGVPQGIVKGILKDSKKIQAIIKELEAIEKRKRGK